MGIERLGLSDADLDVLAAAMDTTVLQLRADLDRRPWSILDHLEHPGVVQAALEPEDPFRSNVSPFLFFAVLAQQAANDLRGSTYVNEWTGPRQRLPVFDVEPLREFAEAPGRVLFIAQLLAAFARPSALPVPANALDLEDVAAWIEVSVPEDQVTLLRHLGDLALFRSGVLADETGPHAIDATLIERLLHPLRLSADELASLHEHLADAASVSPGIDAMESLGPTWYRAASHADDRGRLSLTVTDIATRFRPARRFLNHLADQYLNPGSVAVGLSI